jgi:putative ABC transport system permease protein
MSAFQIFQVLSEAFIFALVAFGIYVAFLWLRFPDLTPDGSFTLGAGVYAISVGRGISPLAALVLAFGAGMVAGSCTAILNRIVRIPAVVAGLLVASALYSITWLLMRQPNKFIDPRYTLIGDVSGSAGPRGMALWSLCIVILTGFLLSVFSQTIWGLRLRAIGENPLLAQDLGLSRAKYTLLGLAVANGLIGVAGALFAQRSYSADINMGVGITIAGLAGLLLGLLFAAETRRIWLIISFITLGCIVYKGLFFVSLELGIPPEAFRLLSSSLLVAAFMLFSRTAMDMLRGLKWN